MAFKSFLRIAQLSEKAENEAEKVSARGGGAAGGIKLGRGIRLYRQSSLSARSHKTLRGGAVIFRLRARREDGGILLKS